MLRKLLLVLLPVGVAAAPWIFFSAPSWWSKVTAAISSTGGHAADPDAATLESLTRASPAKGAGASGTTLPRTRPTSDEPLMVELADAFRFDQTLDWITSHWPHVSASLAQLQLQGYRVPLVSGTAEDDVAGALTYYFDPRQRLQRITFQGTTGNTRRLVALLSTRFGFARRLVNDPSLFVYEVPRPDRKPKSVMWIRPAPVFKASETYQRFQVTLVVDRPEE